MSDVTNALLGAGVAILAINAFTKEKAPAVAAAVTDAGRTPVPEQIPLNRSGTDPWHIFASRQAAEFQYPNLSPGDLRQNYANALQRAQNRTVGALSSRRKPILIDFQDRTAKPFLFNRESAAVTPQFRQAIEVAYANQLLTDRNSEYIKDPSVVHPAFNHTARDPSRNLTGIFDTTNPAYNAPVPSA